MSKIDDLIQKLCPDGVEHKKLSEVANVQRGVRVVRKNLSERDGYPVYQNSLAPLGYYSKANEPAGTPFVIGAGAAADIGYSAEEYWGADDCYSIECGDRLIGRFIYYVLLSRQHRLKARVRKASIPRLARVAIEQLDIPVPPLEVQEEVVRILDSFAKLEARRQQYAHYRDRLLNFERARARESNCFLVCDK